MTHRELTALAAYADGQIDIYELATSFVITIKGKKHCLNVEKLKELLERKKPTRKCEECEGRFTCWTNK